ncbi:predicted protein [Methanosarcina acetivorans C2A]|uniref:Uncharacterized protein n=1 Tax=Methanosarcina acetivorans (strain ATCC 35395 / DSM 2834 / JCM 12185 / C2A) TaxID=188937 RepID=Q8TK09_METAC|nr:predicted protein [Methanosarcina acetivorans C2A]
MSSSQNLFYPCIGQNFRIIFIICDSIDYFRFKIRRADFGFWDKLIIYDSSKKIPKEISDTYSKVYGKAIEEFSNKHCKLNGMQIEVFFRPKKVEITIRKYLKI